MDVVGEVIEGVGGFVDMRAVVGALAGLDHHDVLVEGLTILAAELDADSSGVVRAAAAAVHAGTAVLGTVLLQAGAAGVGELYWLAGLLGSAALLSFLQRKEKTRWRWRSVMCSNPEVMYLLYHACLHHIDSQGLKLTFRLE